jgi:hypothetical protein
MVGRVTQEGEEPYVHGRLGTTPWVVWIYLDQAQLSGPGPAAANLEQWDARTPDELIEKFLGRVRQALDDAGV